MDTKIGVIKYIASSSAKGIKFENEPEVWYNPTNDAKKLVTNSMKGQPVKIVLTSKAHEFSNIILAKVVEEEQLEVIEEIVTDEPKEEKVPLTTPPKEEKHSGLSDMCSNAPEVFPKIINLDIPEMNLHAKLSAIQVELKAPKNQVNSFAKFNYRSTSDILESLKPLLAKYGVSVLLTDRVYVKATAVLLDNDSNEQLEVVGLAREQKERKGMDEAQVTGSASSYARKYALNGLFAIDDAKDIDEGDNN